VYCRGPRRPDTERDHRARDARGVLPQAGRRGPDAGDESVDGQLGELPETLRESNRRQADHIPAKLQAIDCALVPLEAWSVPNFELTAAEVEQLARLEHDRWMAERLLDGWTYTPGPKDVRRKRTPWLIPWKEMPEDQRDYDRNTVRHLPRFLAQAGLGVVRLDGARAAEVGRGDRRRVSSRA
jgi:hypothetical protein